MPLYMPEYLAQNSESIPHRFQRLVMQKLIDEAAEVLCSRAKHLTTLSREQDQPGSYWRRRLCLRRPVPAAPIPLAGDRCRMILGNFTGQYSNHWFTVLCDRCRAGHQDDLIAAP